MADKGPFLTSCIIFYLSIGAAIFQILEEKNWTTARDRYIRQKEDLLKKFSCLKKEDLEYILKVVAEAAGQGVAITGDNHRNTWDWPNSVIFAATIVTTIGYGNVAPKTPGGRVFCIIYGLCGIPLCLVWISELGSFFGERAKRLSQVLLHKGVSPKKVQFACTAIFLLWGLLMHMVIPSFVFMSMEGWSYLEGIYFSFITLTTVGFGDYVAGVNPDIQYPTLYRVCAEIWIYMGLAWLSLFFSWNVNMVEEAHKILKKKRLRHRQAHRFYNQEPEPSVEKPNHKEKPSVIDIFSFLSEKEKDYSTIIKEIGMTARKTMPIHINRSKSCSDILAIETLDQSPRQRRRVSVCEVLMIAIADKNEDEEIEDESSKANCESENDGISFTVPTKQTQEEESVRPFERRESRFSISKVSEQALLLDNAGKG